MRNTIAILFIISTLHGYTQGGYPVLPCNSQVGDCNLIKNPGFEEFVNNDDYIANIRQNDMEKNHYVPCWYNFYGDWYYPNLASVSNSSLVAKKWYDPELGLAPNWNVGCAKEGPTGSDKFVGFIYMRIGSGHKEFFMQTIDQLEAGREYYIEAYFRNADKSRKTTNRVRTQFKELTADANYITYLSNGLAISNEWTKTFGKYKADGTEVNIRIGRRYSDPAINTSTLSPQDQANWVGPNGTINNVTYNSPCSTVPYTGSKEYCYLFMDDVKLVPFDAGQDVYNPCSDVVTIGPSCPIEGASYSWSPTTGLSDPNVSNPTVSGLAVSTTYTVTITVEGENGYEVSGSDEMRVLIDNPFVYDVTETCFQSCNGSASVFPQLAYNSIVWSNGETGLTANNLCEGTNEVTITYRNGCTQTVSFDTPLKPGPEIEGSLLQCDLDNTYSVPLAPNMSYYWSINGGTKINTSGASTDVVWSNSGVGEVQLIAIEGKKCKTVSTLEVAPCCNVGSNSAITLANHNFSYFINHGVLSATNQTVGSKNGCANPNNTQMIFINGEIDVDVDYTFENCHIKMGENAKLNILPGSTLSIVNSKVEACGNELWKGIFAETSDAKIVINNSCVDDANSGIVMRNNAQFEIYKNTFGDNYQSLKFADYSPGIPAGSILSNNKINGTNNNLLSPRSGVKATYGVRLERCGKASTSQKFIIENNWFSNYEYGVYSTKSSYKVFNCTFNYIKNTAIKSIWGNEGNGVKHIAFIGDNSIANTNSFGNCETAISISNMHRVVVRNNNFREISNYGIYLNDIKWTYANIDNNEFDEAAYGIKAETNKGASFNIKENTFSNVVSGVAVIEANSDVNSVKIHDNQFSQVLFGVYLENIQAPEVNENTVSAIQRLGMTYGRGVYLKGCTNGMVNNNRLMGDYNNGDNIYINAIRIENSASIEVTCNLIRSIGVSIEVSGNCINSSVYGNFFVRYMRGIKLSNNGVIGPQHVTSNFLPTDNKFSDGFPSSYDTYAENSNGNSSQFWARTTSPLYWPISHGSSGSGTPIAFNATSGNEYSCDGSGNSGGIANRSSSPQTLDYVVDIQLYPNPTKGKFEINSKGNHITKVEIVSAIGRKIQTLVEPGEIFEVDLSGFQNGVYLVKISTKNSATMKQVVKH